MPVRRLRQGEKHEIFTWADGDRSQFEAFLAELGNGQKSAQRSLVALITRTANEGPPENEEQCRVVDRGHGADLYVLTIHGGISVFWFYSGEAIIICLATKMGKGGRIKESDLKEALTIKRLYFGETRYDPPKDRRSNKRF